jgi:hypothetical protein
MKLVGLELWCLAPLSTIFQLYRGGRDHMVVGFTTTAIKTKVLSMNAARGEVYSIQLYVVILYFYIMFHI